MVVKNANVTLSIGSGLVVALLLVNAAGVASAAAPQTPPEIRMHDRNRVPSCVTPERLMRFLSQGNSNVKPQFRDIARYYKEHGEKLRIRWDYAFYQMVIETNYLKFVNNAGQGDVNPKQNNFAGIGTTGGGVPGDSFPDVSTGVLGQMQHLIAYSGERVDQPVAKRTREKQDEIIQKSKALGRAPTFKDLARRWAADARYGTSIEFIASRYRSSYCAGNQAEPEPEIVEKAGGSTKVAAVDAEADERPRGKRGRDSKRRSKAAGKNQVASKQVTEPVVTDAEIAAEDADKTESPRGADLANRAIENGKATGDNRRLGLTTAAPLASDPAPARSKGCSVLTASYGGQKNVLIRVMKAGETQYTALQVLDGQEKSLADSFIKTHAAGGELVDQFPNREAALIKAFDLCPTAAR